MQSVLTIYTDGSYRDRGAWANVLYDDRNKRFPCVAYGSCSAETSTHAETIACIRALDNYDLFKNYDRIEIRTDQMYIVEIANKAENCRSMNLELPEDKYKKYSEELHCIAYIQYQLGKKIKFKKTRENRFLKLAHNHAKRALDLDPDNETYLYKAEPQDKPKVIQLRNSRCVDLKDQFSDVSELMTSGQNNEVLEESNSINLKVSDVDIISKTHLEAAHLKLGGELARVRNETKKLRPITVRPLHNGRFELISGFRSYCIAKIVDVEYIPCIVIDKTLLSDNNCA